MSATIGREEEFDPTLYNDDLAPIPEERRNWSWVNYSTVWMGMVHNVVLILAMWANSIAGAKYGLPFPVLRPDRLRRHYLLRFGLSRKGRIEPGMNADLAVVDLEQDYALGAGGLFYRHRHSAYVRPAG